MSVHLGSSRWSRDIGPRSGMVGGPRSGMVGGPRSGMVGISIISLGIDNRVFLAHLLAIYAG